MNFQQLVNDNTPVSSVDFGGATVLGVDPTFGPFGSAAGAGTFLTMSSFGFAGQQLWQRFRTSTTNLGIETWNTITLPPSGRCGTTSFLAKKIVTTGVASWAIDLCGDIWTSQDTRQGWWNVSASIGGCAQDIAVGAEWRDAVVVGCGPANADAQIWHFTGTGWQGDNGSGVAVAASKTAHVGATYGQIYVINLAHQLWMNSNFP
jgi:hypothetical protein